MSYTYPIEPAAMFEDRMVQILGFGIPEADVKTLQKTSPTCGRMRASGLLCCLSWYGVRRIR